MTESENEPRQGDHKPEEESAGRHRRSRIGRRSLWTFALATLLAAVAVLSFGAGAASAESTGTGTTATQTDGTADNGDTDSDDSDSTCERKRGKHRGAIVDVLTEVLGIDSEALQEARQSGSTISEIAADNDVGVDDVIDALGTAATERAEEKGREIDADALTEKITAFVNGERPDGADEMRRRFNLGRSQGHAHLGAGADAT